MLQTGRYIEPDVRNPDNIVRISNVRAIVSTKTGFGRFGRLEPVPNVRNPDNIVRLSDVRAIESIWNPDIYVRISNVRAIGVVWKPDIDEWTGRPITEHAEIRTLFCPVCQTGRPVFSASLYFENRIKICRRKTTLLPWCWRNKLMSRLNSRYKIIFVNKKQ